MLARKSVSGASGLASAVVGLFGGDHDMALAYVLLCDPEALPSYALLPEEQRAPLRFTQADIGFNHGWLVQAIACTHP